MNYSKIDLFNSYSFSPTYFIMNIPTGEVNVSDTNFLKCFLSDVNRYTTVHFLSTLLAWVRYQIISESSIKASGTNQTLVHDRKTITWLHLNVKPFNALWLFKIHEQFWFDGAIQKWSLPILILFSLGIILFRTLLYFLINRIQFSYHGWFDNYSGWSIMDIL